VAETYRSTARHVAAENCDVSQRRRYSFREHSEQWAWTHFVGSVSIAMTADDRSETTIHGTSITLTYRYNYAIYPGDIHDEGMNS